MENVTTEQLKEVLNKLRTIDKKVIKSNLRVECAKLYKEYGGRDKVRKATGLKSSVFESMINTGSASGITLENFIILISTLNIDVNEILVEKKLPVVTQGLRVNKIWTDEVKKEFIRFCEANTIYKASQQYNLRKITAELYYKNFKEEFKNETR